MEIPYDGGDNTPARYHILLNKTIVQGMGYIVLNHLPKGFPKHYRLLPMLFIPPHNLKVRTYC